MKKLIILMGALAAAAFLVHCGNEVTEVAWKNSTDSNGSIEEIVWAEGDAEWYETVGKGSLSSTKEVTKLVGEAECKVESSEGSGDFDVAQVHINDNLGAYALSEGSSHVLTLKATR